MVTLFLSFSDQVNCLLMIRLFQKLAMLRSLGVYQLIKHFLIFNKPIVPKYKKIWIDWQIFEENAEKDT